MKLKYNFEIMEIDDSNVAVPVGDNTDDFHGIVKLNDSALVVFEMLQEGITEEEIIQQLVQTYDQPEDEIAAFVKEFIDQLIRENLIEQ